jgi:hypothetical protein
MQAGFRRRRVSYVKLGIPFGSFLQYAALPAALAAFLATVDIAIECCVGLNRRWFGECGCLVRNEPFEAALDSIEVIAPESRAAAQAWHLLQEARTSRAIAEK